MTFNIKQNDTSPTFEATCLNEDGFPIDLTGATSVRFHVRNAAGSVVIDKDMIVDNAVGGVVYYAWEAADTATVGIFQAEVEVTYSTGRIETFPNDSYLEIIITDDIA